MRKLLQLVLLLYPMMAFGQATVNWTNVHQQIDGFGAADTGTSYGTQLTSSQQAFFFGTGSGDLGFSILRVGLPNNSENIGSCTSVNTGCAGASWVISDMQYAASQGAKIYSSPWSPPAIYTVGNTTICSSGNSTLATGDYANYATYFLNYVQSVSAQGVSLFAVSVQNEPDICQSYDSSQWSAGTIDTFVKSNLGPTFSSNSVSTLIFEPEASNYSATTSLGATCGTDSSCYNYVGGYNWHDYQASCSGTTCSANTVPGGWATGKRWWETEASCGSGFGPSFCQSGFQTNITDALSWASVVDQRMQDGANAWLYWLLVGYTGAATSDDQSLMGNAATGFAVAKRAYMLGQYAKFVRPGMYRIDATHIPQPGVTVSAYQNTSSSTWVTVATNQNSSSVSQTISLINGPTFTSVTPTVTSSSLSLAPQSSISVSGNSFTYTLPANSITTFVGTGSGGTTYTLSTSVVGSGTISGCAGTYASGASYSCTVTPSGGYTLSSVTGCGGSGTTTYAGTMPSSNCTVTATFTSGSQLWTGLLATNRAPSFSIWPNAGAGAIPPRTTICQTLGVAGQAPSYAQSVTVANIVSALNTCAGTNETVLLNPGTYTMTTTMYGPGDGGTWPSNVTLRGSGANQTILKWSASASLNTCLGVGPTLTCRFNGDGGAGVFADNILQVTAGVSQGSTSITIGTAASSGCYENTACSGSLSNLKVGSLMQINQCDTGLSGPNCSATGSGGTYVAGSPPDNGALWVCGLGPSGSTATCTWGGQDNGYPSRGTNQTVLVTGISGSTVTFTPALIHPNWTQSQSPFVVFSNYLPVVGSGLENLQINSQLLGDIQTMDQCEWCYQSWTKNVSFVNAEASGTAAAARKHDTFSSGLYNSGIDSYMYGSSPSSEGYGWDLSWGETGSLIQNNIVHHVATAYIMENAVGSVFGYNFAVDNFYTGGGGDPNWQQCDYVMHDEGDGYDLLEGHEGTCATYDNDHGTDFPMTIHRSILSGHDQATTCPSTNPSCGTGSKTQHTFAFEDNQAARYNNTTLSVLGTSSYDTVYQNQGASGSPNSCPSFPETAIYSLNFANGNQIPFSPTCTSTAYTIDNDPLVSSSLMRWGNYDTVNAAVRTNSGETASSAPTYPGLASPSTSYSSYPSLYLSSKPAWLGSITYPVNGPDVTGGNIANVGGHANHNAAGTCYYGPLGGVNTGASGPLNFDAYTVCDYGSSTPQAATPIPSPSPGPYVGTQTVSFSFPTAGSTGHCTTNGTTPTTGSPTYTGPYTVSTTTTLYCIAIATGYTTSSVGGGTVTINPPSPIGTQGTVVFKGTIQVVQ